MQLKTETLIFQHRQENIYPFLLEVSRFLQTHLPQPNAQAEFKAKVVITELLTNSIKHVGNGQTSIQLMLSHRHFSIVKIDNGAPLSVGSQPLHWPLSQATNTRITVYADSLNGLYAQVTSPDSLTFYTEDYDADADALTDLSEHYGLLIIARACNAFTYQYNAQTSQNTFTAIIDL